MTNSKTKTLTESEQQENTPAKPKRKNTKAKGNTFEREVCVQLSLWWSNSKRDDLFCRSNSSGGRATQRAKKDKKTANQYGDVSLSDPDGQDLLRMFVFELKRGYNTTVFQELIDTDGKSQIKEWITHAKECSEQSGSKSWLIVHKRDKRHTLCYIPMDVFDRICFETRPEEIDPYLCLYNGDDDAVVCLKWMNFLKINPDMVSKYLASCVKVR